MQSCLHHSVFFGHIRQLQQPGCSHLRRSALRAQSGRGFAELLSVQNTKKHGARTKLRQHTVSPRLDVPAHILRPPYVDTGASPWGPQEQLHRGEELRKMRAACKLAAQVLEHAGGLVRPGISTDAIDKAVHKMTIDNNAYPSPLTYGNFPKSVCTSVNECVCHGIPNLRLLENGDIVNIDVTVYLDGYHGDTSRMFYVGSVSPEAKALCETTWAAMHKGIEACGPGVPINAIGRAVHAFADAKGYNIVRDFVGHGVGTWFHSAPFVHHTRNWEPGVMQVGQTFTIEPILTKGSTNTRTWRDKWTVVTADGSLAAQCEHTILITDAGHEILTVC